MKQLTLLLLSIMSLTVYGQSPLFQTLSMKNGLPHNTVNEFTQDSLGFIWIATDNGITRYDTHNFKNYVKTGDNKGPLNNQILSLLYQNESECWIGTASSLDLFDLKKETFQHFQFKSSFSGYDTPVNKVLELNDSTLLIGTNGGGIRGFNKRVQKFFNIIDREIEDDLGVNIESIYLDSKGQLWVFSHDKGMKVINKEMDEIVYTFPFETQKQAVFTDALPISNNQILISSYGDGLFHFNINNFQYKKVEYASSDEEFAPLIFSIVKFKTNIYISTDGGGIFVLDLSTNKIQNWKKKGQQVHALGSNAIRTIFLDKEENIWLGHYQAGISIMKNKKAFNNIPHNPSDNFSLSYSHVSSLLYDDNKLWIGTDGGGLNTFENGKVSFITELDGKKIPNKILSLFKDSRGWIWMGSYLEGLYLYQEKEQKLINLEKDWNIKLPHGDIRCFYEDQDNNIWVGTHGGGILIVNTKTKATEVISASDSMHNLSIDFIRIIRKDSYGLIWVGTSYGLNCYDPIQKKWRNYLPNREINGLRNGFINVIYEDHNSQLWVGTGDGLYLFNRNKDFFSCYSKAHGMSSNIVVGMLEDKENNLWITTDNGLTKINAKREFIQFDESDGLIENTFFHSAVAKSENDEIFLGSVNGLIYFQPSQIVENYNDIGVAFTGIKVFNEEINNREVLNGRQLYNQNFLFVKELEFFKKENVLTFEFASTTYSFSDKVKFEYQLEGFNSNWISVEQGRSITYTNLDQGQYVLKVRVSNMGSHQPVSTISFKILPPFYETFIFKTFLFILIIGLFWLFWRLRYIKIKREKNLLEKEVEIEKIKSEQDQIQLEKIQLESVIKDKKTEIDLNNTKLMSNTLLMVNKNEIMNQVKSNIIHFSDNIVNPEVKDEINELLKIIDTGFKIEDDWDYFEGHFDQIHKDFFKKVKEKYPDLTLPYVKLIAYLKLELTTKEIATLLNISVRGVEKSRYRLRKKLGMDKGTSFHEVLEEL